MSFSVTGAHVCVVLFYFVYPFVGTGARGWVVDTAGCMADSILLARVELLAKRRVVLGI